MTPPKKVIKKKPSPIIVPKVIVPAYKAVGDSVHDFTSGISLTPGSRVAYKKDGMFKDYIIKSQNLTKGTVVIYREGLPQVTSEVSVTGLEQPCTPDVNTRVGWYEDLTRLTIDRVIKAMLVIGEGGISKSFTVIQACEENLLEEDVDYVKISGNCSPYAAYQLMYEFREKLVIFDDCDSILNDPVSGNIMKAGLDTFAKKRVISWETTKGAGKVPKRFEFTGSCIVISNQSKERFSNAFLSRCCVVDMRMTIDERIEFIEARIDSMNAYDAKGEPIISITEKFAVLDLMKQYKTQIKNFNVRTFLTAGLLYSSTKNLLMARYQLISN